MTGDTNMIEQYASEISQLEEKCRRLEDELARYEFAYGPLGDIVEPHSPVDAHYGYAHLPAEVLSIIFDWAMEPSFLIRPTFATIPSDAWAICMRTKHSLTLVCRSWNAVALEYLYRDIGFTSIGQIAAFQETLSKSKGDLASSVRTITVACYVASYHRHVYYEDLCAILLMCRRLHSFSTCIRESLDPFDHRFQSYLCPISLPRSVVNLSLNDEPHLTVAEVLPLAKSTSCRLQSLHLTLTDSTEDDMFERNLVFECLTTFSLDCRRVDILHMVSRWSTPRLKYLTISSVNLPDAENSFLVFLMSKGREIEYLHLRDGWSTINGSNQQGVQQYCPKLQHLVMSFRMRWTVSHPSVRWVDIWEPPEYTGGAREIPSFRGYVRRLPTVFPALRGIRTLDYGLFFMPDLPRILRPTEDIRDVAVFEHPGICVKQSAGRLWRADMKYTDIDDGDNDDNDLVRGADESITAGVVHRQNNLEGLEASRSPKDVVETASEGRSEVMSDEGGSESSGDDDNADDPWELPLSSDGTESIAEDEDAPKSPSPLEDDFPQRTRWTHEEVLQAFRRASPRKQAHLRALHQRRGKRAYSNRARWYSDWERASQKGAREKSGLRKIQASKIICERTESQRSVPTTRELLSSAEH
ncbi:uncharacterized protein SCHCODRAFT_02583550 [Schizophyllum commune H4-8]|uniref:F-box domain-containing protein n=1 Tax=Schizophyllum commune (strain H4-8 / FGSC 9210) TaxID=578458 RepID=D8Q9D1_SCHCM|nr:uncharacterized protein SCHCODRAFT_02583550 [Schizophyllum commune H4-8]KAI5890461.1 hypothetical protein SCHCODRAFT_02583550 [Schizophyllum commune H4-8]